MMKVAHLFAGGNIGGIECLCRDYIEKSIYEHVILVVWGDGPILNELKKRGVQVIYLNLSSKKIAAGIREVKNICKKEHIDILIAEHEAVLSHIIIYMLKVCKFPVKTIAYAHCHASFMCRENQRRGLKYRKLILSKSLNKADCVIAISKNVANSLVRCFDVHNDHIRIIYNGVRLPDEKENNLHVDRKSDKYEIIYVGRLIEEKGVQTIIKALGHLNDNYHLAIVGDGPFRNQLEVFGAEYLDRITFYGFQSDVGCYLSNADVFVHVPDCEEGFGLTVAEAMAAGKICIVGNRGALPELITNGVDGYIIESGNEFDLAIKIKSVFENLNSEQMKFMRRRAVKKALEFSIRNYTDKMDSLLETLLK